MDERIATDIASIAPKWPDPSREQDAVEAIRYSERIEIILISTIISS